MKAGRLRVSGLLSRGKRGLTLTTSDDQFWVIDNEYPVDDLVGAPVIVEGIAIGIDRLRADWIGPSPANNEQ